MIIIGAGVAGLASAIRLAMSGYSVKVFEANSYAGGKLTEINVGEFRFDAGPSLFTMPQYVDELVDDSSFKYKRLTEVCKYFWADGTTLNASSDIEQLATDISNTLGEDRQSIIKYFERSKQKYEISGLIFLENSLHRIKTWISKSAIKAYFKLPMLDIFKSLHSVNKKAFRNKKTVQLFDRYATYNGSDPYQCSGIMSMIPHFEFHFGAYFPKGGMISIVNVMQDKAIELGVQFYFDTKVASILHEGKVCNGVVLEDGAIHKADIIISNMDVLNSYRYLLKDRKMYESYATLERSTSGLIFYFGVRGDYQQLGLHNIFFSEDYEAEFTALAESKVYHDPTLYLNISSKENATDAPSGHENWFILLNVPAGGYSSESWVEEYRNIVLSKLSRILDVNISERIVCEEYLDPAKIESRTSSSGGALYGTSSNDMNAAFFRQRNKSNLYQNLYFVGGSAHPGGGIPLCLLSGKITADLINET